MYDNYSKLIRFGLLLIGIHLLCAPLVAQVMSLGSGQWNQSSTWSSGTIPTASDHVIIQENHIINHSGSAARFASLTINASSGGNNSDGELRFARNRAVNGPGEINNYGKMIIQDALRLNVNLNNYGILLYQEGRLRGNTNSGVTLTNWGLVQLEVSNRNITHVSFVNKSGARFRKLGTGDMIISDFINESGGLVSSSNGNSLSFDGTLVNSGAFQIDGRLYFEEASISWNSGSSLSGSGILTILGDNLMTGTSDFVPDLFIIEIDVVSGLFGGSNQSLVIPSNTYLDTYDQAILTGFSSIQMNGEFYLFGTTYLGSDLINRGSVEYVAGDLFGNLNNGTLFTNFGIVNVSNWNAQIVDVSFLNKSGASFNKTFSNNQDLPDFVNEAGGIVTTDANSFTFTGNSTNDGEIDSDGLVYITGLMEGKGDFSGNIRTLGSGVLSPSCMSFSNNYFHRGVYQVDIQGVNPCLDFDQIQIAGNLNINAFTEVLSVNIGSYVPPTGSLFTIAKSSNVIGTFNIIDPPLPPDWSVLYDIPSNGDVSLQYTGPSQPMQFRVETAQACANSTVVIPVNVRDFQAVANYQGSITYDPAELTFISASNPHPDVINTFGEPGVGNVPADAITYAWYEPNGGTLNLADDATIMELTFETVPSASSGLSSVSINGNAIPLGYSIDVNAISLLAPSTLIGGVDIEADPPTVSTVPSLSVTLDPNGQANITVNDIDNGSSDPCGIASLSLDQSSFDCNDVANSPITVTLTATDINGNSASATSNVNVIAEPNIAVSGEARTETSTNLVNGSGTLIPLVDFDLSGDDGPQMSNGTSFSLLVNPCDPVNEISAERINDASPNGIDVQDAIDVVKHFLFIQPFNSPYKFIAADVNDTESINVLDAFQIMRRFLGITTSFIDPISGNSGGVWTFVPKAYSFPNPTVPWGFDTQISLLNVNSPLAGQDFIGVKLGDVNNSWDLAPNRLSAPQDSMTLLLEEGKILEKERLLVAVRLKGEEVAGLQFTLEWNNEVLEFEGIESGDGGWIFNSQQTDDGRLAGAWIDLNGGAQRFDGSETAFFMTYRRLEEDGQQADFKLSHDITATQARDKEGKRMGISLQSSRSTNLTSHVLQKEQALGLFHLQNIPNPFKESTSIQFHLERRTELDLVIYNVMGQKVWERRGMYEAGMNQLLWDGKSDKGSVLSAGTYLLKMNGSGAEGFLKIQKSK
ncbi:MAG: cohesin domain-containing protein [Bacteroidota bacterium]